MANAQTSMWLKFFTEAGLPPGISTTYALTFTENRIQMNMLLDLNKEYLREMGIVCMGDVIAILRHAKLVHEETARDKVLSMTSQKSIITKITTNRPKRTPIKFDDPGNSIKNDSTTSNSDDTIKKRLGEIRTKATKRKTASDTLSEENGFTNQSESNNLNISKIKRIHISRQSVHDSDATFSNDEKVNVYPVNNNIFARLDFNEEAKRDFIKSEPNPNSSSRNLASKVVPKNVFSRLGDKDAAVPTKMAIAEDSERFIVNPIKAKSEMNPNKILIKSNGEVRTLENVTSRGTMRADREALNSIQRLHMIKKKSVKFSPLVDFKEIERRPAKIIGTNPVLSNVVLDHLKSSLPRNVTKVPVAPIARRTDVKSRLGAVNTLLHGSVKNTGVFKRLGMIKH